MAIKTLTQFDGGLSNNNKTGLPHSCRFSRFLDIYSNSDSVSLNPVAVKDSSTIVTDLVKWIVDSTPYATDRYAYGDSGNIYKIASGVWSVDRAVGVGAAAGQGLLVMNNYLYYPTSTTLGRKGLLSGIPTYNDDFISDGVANLDFSQNTSATSNSYTLLNAVSEATVDTLQLVLDYDPVKEIDVYLATKGTGNWTLTVHDFNNIVQGTATVANGSLVSAGHYQPFIFSTPLRYPLSSSAVATWHIHLTSSDGTGTVNVLTSSNFSTVNIKEFFGILIADTNYHPAIGFTNGVNGTVLIGNGNYIAEYNIDTNLINPNRIVLDPGYSVRFWAKENEFVIAFCWRGTAIDSFEDGIAYWWDGNTNGYNYLKPITSGSPNSAVNFKNRIVSVLGSSGDLNIGTEPFRKIQPVPQLARGKKIEVLPAGMTVWQERLHIGYGANTDDSSGLEQGVYEFGNQSDRAITYQSVSTEVLNYGYQISTGTTKSTTMKIGCVAAFGKDMYIAWKDASTYGVDKVSKTNNPSPTGSWESLIDDDTVDAQGNFISAPQRPKDAKKLVISFVSLPTGCTVTPKYRLDRPTSGGDTNHWTLGVAEEIGIAGQTIAQMEIDKRYQEAEYGFDVVATTGYPIITSVSWIFDPLVNEREENVNG